MKKTKCVREEEGKNQGGREENSCRDDSHVKTMIHICFSEVRLSPYDRVGQSVGLLAFPKN